MKILLIEKSVEGVEDQAILPYLKEEAIRLWEVYKSGIVRDFYFTKYDHKAVLILECKDEIHAHQIAESLPLVKKGLIKFQIIPLVPYDGFERLFEKK